MQNPVCRIGADATPVSAVALLLHLDDLHPESLPLGAATVARVGGLVAHLPVADARVPAADDAAMANALTRAGEHFGCPVDLIAPHWACDLPVVTAPSGVLRVRRAWDEAAWPHATRGYFQVRSAIPKILKTVGCQRD